MIKSLLGERLFDTKYVCKPGLYTNYVDKQVDILAKYNNGSDATSKPFPAVGEKARS
jgi:hypothetical protein